jgi:hypothetical protein
MGSVLHPNAPGSNAGRMLSDAISNEKIRCQEKLFFQKGFDGPSQLKIITAAMERFFLKK